MANDSSTGGYLAPFVTTPPTEDGDLDAQLQALVVGITGLDDTLVRPRWQPVVPKQPGRTIDWCAIGVITTAPDDTAAIIHTSAAGVEQDTLQRHEVIEVMASFYGPNANGYLARLRDGLSIAQNREALQAQGLGFIATDRTTKAGDFVNQGWIGRSDIVLRFRRIVTRTYAVLDIASSTGTVLSQEAGDTPFNVEP